MVKRSSASKKGQHGGKKRRRGEATTTTTTTNTANAPRLVKGELGFVRAAEEAGVRLVRAPVGLSRRKMNHSRIHPKYVLPLLRARDGDGDGEIKDSCG